MAKVREEFDGDGHQGEAARADNGQDDVRTREAPGFRHPYEDDEARCDDGDNNLDGEQEVFGAVQDGRRDGGGDEADDDEDGAADASLVVGEAVGEEDLVEETGHGVEEADVD